MSRTTMPPRAASTLETLTADVLAVNVARMLDELAGAGNWPAAKRVRESLEAYQEIRTGSIVNALIDAETEPVTRRNEARS